MNDIVDGVKYFQSFSHQ